MWIVFGVLAGVLLGLYDFWTKKSMEKNGVINIVFWTSFFGMLALVPAIALGQKGAALSLSALTLGYKDQLLIFAKGTAMTLSWIMAYYSVKELPMSFSGAVRASGPLWTFVGGVLLFGEFLTPLQFALILISVASYYAFSQIGKKEGIHVLKSKPVLMMLAATMLSAATTAYDKYLVQNTGISAVSIQAVSAIHRFALAAVIFGLYKICSKNDGATSWSFYIPLVGVAWVAAEYVYFLAIVDPESNVTYLSVFRRTSLIIGFILSAVFLQEKFLKQKAVVIGILVLSTVILIVKR